MRVTNHTIIVGPQGSGKTTLIKAILRNQSHAIGFLDGDKLWFVSPKGAPSVIILNECTVEQRRIIWDMSINGHEIEIEGQMQIHRPTFFIETQDLLFKIPHFKRIIIEPCN